MLDRSTHALVGLVERALTSAIRREEREALRRYAACDREPLSGARGWWLTGSERHTTLIPIRVLSC